METLVGYELRDAVAMLTMDDGKANVMSVPMLQALNAALDRAQAVEEFYAVDASMQENPSSRPLTPSRRPRLMLNPRDS